MAKEVRLPALGENVEAGDVVSILVKAGDRIEENQTILELETDKATVEVPSPLSGVVEKIAVSPGDTISVGQVILSVTEPDSSPEAAEKEPASGESQAAPEPVQAEAVPESAPREEAPSRADAPPAAGIPSQAESPAAETTGAQISPAALIPASPAVRRVAREIGVDLARVRGTGPKGRITIDDVKLFSRSSRTAPPVSTAVVKPLPDFTRYGPVAREPFTAIRRVTAEHLSHAWAVVARVTNHDRADITELEQLRRKWKGRVEAAGGKLTMTAIAVKILSAALKVFPRFNASIDIENQEIVYKKYFHIGVAVDTEKGLLVPVIKDVDRKNVTELAVELKALADRARQGRIAPDELQGGCITITNLGGIGGTSFTPIVNYPEAAILGMSRAVLEPVYREEEFHPRLMLPLSLSYDHRLIDGAEAARFLRWLAEAFESPFLLALEG